MTVLRTPVMVRLLSVCRSIDGTDNSRMPGALATLGKMASAPAFSTMNSVNYGGILVEMRP